MGISKLRIYQVGIQVLAEATYFNHETKTVCWNNTEERKHILEQIDGYTYIKDERI